MKKTGIFLVNLGTPNSAQADDVGEYLKEFLTDPRVIEGSWLRRQLLVRGIIVPFRKKKSAAAYQTIWEKDGSPLLFHTKRLGQKLGARLPGKTVKIGMRYGKPAIRNVLKEFVDEGVLDITVLPLFPQYSSAATGSAMAEIYEQAAKFEVVPRIRMVPEFYDHEAYLESMAKVVKPYLEKFQPDHLLMSFHGLPESQILASDATSTHCLKSNTCCDKMVSANRSCYRAQSFETARLLSRTFNFPNFSVSFQSRLGKTPWIKPYSDEVVPDLGKKGVKKLAVICPAFVADCLETIEEVGDRLRETFLENGGKDFCLIPCLNDHDAWVEGLVKLLGD